MSEVGRASMHINHVALGQAGTANRERLAEEAGRHEDEQSLAKQADRNENVDPARSHGNEFWVNDGAGGLRLGTTAEAVAYGDDRLSRVRLAKRMNESTKVLTEFVVHLPKSMCTEETWTNDAGEVRTYWRARDAEEARRYFEVAHEEILKVLPGGGDAVHWRALNVDEFTPHMQYVCDTLAPDDGKKAKPGDLRVAYHDAYGSSRRSKVTTNGGREVQLTGPKKYAGYQKAFRERMIAEGFPVEAQPDPIRSRRSLDKAEYIDVQRQREAVEQEDARVQTFGATVLDYEAGVKAREAKLKQVHEILQDREAQADEREATLSEREKSLTAREADLSAREKELDARAEQIVAAAEVLATDERRADEMLSEAATAFSEARELVDLAADASGSERAVETLVRGMEAAGADQGVMTAMRALKPSAVKAGEKKRAQVAAKVAQAEQDHQPLFTGTRRNDQQKERNSQADD